MYWGSSVQSSVQSPLAGQPAVSQAQSLVQECPHGEDEEGQQELFRLVHIQQEFVLC